MIKSLQDFTGLFKLPETLSFELKPVGKTKEFVENGDFFKNDFTRAEQYPAMKKILDEEHKNLIDRVLGNIPAAIQNLSDKTKEKYKDILNEEQTAIQWSVLSQAIGRDDDSISDLQKKFREMIAELLKTDDSFADLTEATPSKYLKQMNQEQKNDALK